ncbi:MAG: hypothetical protein ACODAQ_03290 [Phycisphaeraceae bacterium]
MLGVWASFLSTEARAGEIRATLETEARIEKVWAVQRKAETITTSKGREKDIGMYGRPRAGRVEGDAIVIDGLETQGRYDLRFETADGAIVQGWDANVPESDYVGDPPLEDADRQRILEKQASDQFTAFADRVRVLDMRGNIQNAVLLVEKVRWRPFVGGGYKKGEWVWRVERWQWENPDEQTWVPYQERPYYALVRQRTDEAGYRAKRVVYARHLGGVVLTSEQPKQDIGVVHVPAPTPGVHAVDEGGEPIETVTLKGERENASE